jgi:hypothetical protein
MLQTDDRNWPTADGHEPSGDEPREVWTGTIERTFSGMGGRGIGMGGMMAGSFLSRIAEVIIGSAIAQSFFGESGFGDTAQGENGSGDTNSDTSAYAGGDLGDFDGGDFGEVLIRFSLSCQVCLESSSTKWFSNAAAKSTHRCLPFTATLLP